MTLTEFLLAQIALDEDMAKYALKYSVSGDDMEVHWKWVYLYRSKNRQLGSWSLGMHVGSPSPARVLAECEAKRHIINLHAEAVAESMRSGSTWAYGEVLRRLALPYADHPDYREEWRP